nr:hypothetical protein [Desulfonema ishimotonii]
MLIGFGITDFFHQFLKVIQVVHPKYFIINRKAFINIVGDKNLISEKILNLFHPVSARQQTVIEASDPTADTGARVDIKVDLFFFECLQRSDFNSCDWPAAG